MENKHTMTDLLQMQSLPLGAKIRMTEARIQAWIDYFGTEGVSISFSGGKDSTVLMDIIRNRMNYKDIPAVFVDVPTQFPELKEFALTWDNVEVLKPKISFMQVCNDYGFPLISKEIARNVCGAKKTYKIIEDEILNNGKEINEKNIVDILNRRIKNREGGDNVAVARMLSLKSKQNSNNGLPCTCDDAEKSNYNHQKYKFLLDSPFSISNKCCDIMKKNPLYEYTKRTKRKCITAQMANESMLRLQAWFRNGCNAFNTAHPKSNPMSFWTE